MARKTLKLKKDMKTPWTWEEIDELRRSEKHAERREFVRLYGPRAIAAIMAAGHAPGTHTSCVDPIGCTDSCPVANISRWRVNRNTACSKDAMAVYARMVDVLGVEQKERKDCR